MELEALPYELTVCKLEDLLDVDLSREFYFLGRTDEELSLVCKTEDTPAGAIFRDDGWMGFRIQGELDFSLIGILSRLTAVLAAEKIGIFAVSTFNTDYVLVRKEHFNQAARALSDAGYVLV